MKYLHRSLFVTLCPFALAALSITANAALAQNEIIAEPISRNATPSAASLPLKQVALFSSGVAYFGRAGQVSGNSEFDLVFRAPEINDVLKSLVLFDAAGEARPVTYSIADFVATRPSTSDLVFGADDSLGGVLKRFQGAMVRIHSGNNPLEGRIVGVKERQRREENGAVISSEAMTLFTDMGLRVVTLEDVTSVQLMDARLDQKLRDSLQKRAASVGATLDDGHRPVRLRYTGKGTREVRAGYLQESPVWKTSYRLVLEPGKKPYLQGWGIVENTTAEDWNGVQLSLISGRPVSFTQNLYQPLYIYRPEVAAQVMGVPRAQIYKDVVLEGRVSSLENRTTPPPRLGLTPGIQHRGDLYSNNGQFQVVSPQDADRRQEMAASAEQLAKSIASEASGSERGELFEYAIKSPVSIARGQAALVPIVSENIEGEKVSILDTSADVLCAVYGFRLRNTTGLNLTGGPITVFQDGIYAGDAQINNMQPGEARLISYALDLDLVIGREGPKTNLEFVSLSAKNGILNIARQQQSVVEYSFRNKSGVAKSLIVQSPIVSGWKLVEPQKPFERSPSEYRFKVEIPAKGTAKLKVVTEQPQDVPVTLYSADFDTLVYYARHGQISAPLKKALEEVVARRRRIAELTRQRTALETELKAIATEQDRIRQNMAQLDRNNALYKQYVTKLTAQETRVEKIREEIVRLSEAENTAQNELRTWLDGLTTN